MKTCEKCVICGKCKDSKHISVDGRDIDAESEKLFMDIMEMSKRCNVMKTEIKKTETRIEELRNIYIMP